MLRRGYTELPFKRHGQDLKKQTKTLLLDTLSLADLKGGGGEVQHPTPPPFLISKIKENIKQSKK